MISTSKRNHFFDEQRVYLSLRHLGATTHQVLLENTVRIQGLRSLLIHAVPYRVLMSLITTAIDR